METLEDTTLTSSISTNHLPEWFLTEILCKLPSKHVIRCTCLSKQFLNLISDPSFIRNYISRASSSSKLRPWTLITRIPHIQGAPGVWWPIEEWFNLQRNLESNILNNSDLPTISKFVTTEEELSLIVAMSNGLFLCHSELIPNFVIFNPITKQIIFLPEPDWWPQSGTVAFHTHVDQVVGVVSYKVARLQMNWSAPTTEQRIEEFSSETNKWTCFTVHFPEPISSLNFITSFTFKGFFHWFDGRSIDGSSCIISYDPVRIIRSPGSGRIIWCGEVVGPGGENTIRCIKHDDEDFINLWRMTDYDQGIWHLDHKFAKSEILLPSAYYNEMLPCRFLTSITFHPSKPDLLFFWGIAEESEWMLVSFNVVSRRSRVSDTVPRVRGNYGDVPSFLETPFVLPPWPVMLPDP